MLIHRLKFILLFIFLSIFSFLSFCFSWSGETWDTMTREEICMIADEMIESYWSPVNDIQNYRSSSNYTWFFAGMEYKGEAYMKWNPVDDWDEFLYHVNSTPGGITYYGNDCSAFVSICWKMTTRHTTSTIEGDNDHVELLGSVGECDDVDLIKGDACNKAGSHIVLFDYYDPSGNGIYTMEQTPETAQRRLRTWSELSTYRPLRRKDLEEAAIPTLSEWKQIFYTLIMLSLVMGFMHSQGRKHAFLSDIRGYRKNYLHLISFNKLIYLKILRFVGSSGIIVLIIIKVIGSSIGLIDLIGSIFCLPLVAYIIHLIILFKDDYENSERTQQLMP